MTVLFALRRPRLWLALWIALLCATLLACLLPLPPVAPAPPHLDKLEHAFGHFVLALYAANLFAAARARALAFGGLVLFGAAIEGLQALTPWRSADLLDLLANVSGTGLALLLGRGRLARVLQRIDRVLP